MGGGSAVRALFLVDDLSVLNFAHFDQFMCLSAFCPFWSNFTYPDLSVADYGCE